MKPPLTAPFGTWRSPMTAESLAEGSLRLTEVGLDGGDIYWLEGRPSGATVLTRWRHGSVDDVTPEGFDVRSRVHEYGGGAYAVRDGLVVFVNFADQRVYRLDPGASEPQPLTIEAARRYGSLHLDPSRRVVYAVQEDHRGGGEPVNTLVRIPLDGTGEPVTVVEGPDFVAQPQVSPDGGRLAWVQWDHPSMPWDSTRLCVASLDEAGDVIGVDTVAGGPTEAVGEARWSPDGRLFWLSDRSGFTNLYAEGPDAGDTCILASDHDFGLPAWSLGTRSYGFTAGGEVVCSWLVDGFGRLGTVSPADGSVRNIETGATAYQSVAVDGDRVACVAGFADRSLAVIEVSLREDTTATVRGASTGSLEAEWASRAEPVTWQNSNGQEVHGFFYPPVNPQFVGCAGELPPLLVVSHGGPTSMSFPVLTQSHQFWTTRGFAVLDVNYSGSSGYGRDYRERLKGSWGVADVDDCASGALAMADQGRADRARLAIRGGSAGGFTTLAALTFTDVFAAGASHYGISDLTTLARDTHKFESRYCDGLVGPYPEAADIYAERSPINHIDRLSSPMILLQGTEDKVVPPSQAEAMADALQAKGIPVTLRLFEGEGHGFRKAENISAALNAEVDFYTETFGFQRAEPVVE